jgi:hypothetical protein
VVDEDAPIPGAGREVVVVVGPTALIDSRWVVVVVVVSGSEAQAPRNMAAAAQHRIRIVLIFIRIRDVR